MKTHLIITQGGLCGILATHGYFNSDSLLFGIGLILGVTAIVSIFIGDK